MTEPGVCPHCKSALAKGVRFCSSCGRFASPEPASWFDRLSAATIDFSVWGVCSALLLWIGLKWWVTFPCWLVLTEIGYHLKGSIGKSLMGLSVPVKNRSQHYLREIVGKLASVAVFGIGFVMVFSKERLALHDYMAGTNVVRVNDISKLRQVIISLSLTCGLAICAYLTFLPVHPIQWVPSHLQSEPTSLGVIVSQMPAVATLYVYDNRGKPVGQGSGFLIESDGIGVTNFHVIKDAYSADVKLGDGRLYHLLAVHAYDEERDIVIFQLGRKTSSGIEQARDLPFVTLATQEVQVGDRIATVGSPEGLSNSVADGLVSAIRTDGGKRLLQISAPISPGSSGGPVFNLKGEVVAISSFQLVEGQNLNFAIPVDEISRIRDRRANLSLEQVYWQFHLSPATRAASKNNPDGAERTGTSSEMVAPLTGTFVGTVHNLTAELTAEFGIFVEENQGVVLGCMGVQKPLYGSGTLLGSVKGADLQFDVTSPVFQIQFQGRRNGNSLSGTYRVISKTSDAQEGEFVLERKDAKGLSKDFEPQKDCPSDTDMNR